jgi:hypothetical protein
MNRVAPGSKTARGSWSLESDAELAPVPDELAEWVLDTRTTELRQKRELAVAT